MRVGLIGAGQMGTDIIVQTHLMTGIEVVAAADAVPENVFSALRASPATAREPRKSPTTPPRPPAPSRAVVSRSAHRIVTCCTSDSVDVVIDATGNPNVGAQVALTTIAAGKHIVMMNVEADVTIGPTCRRRPPKPASSTRSGAGDEPSSTMELVNFLRGLGYPIVAAGKGKNNAFRIDATPDAYVEEATRRNMNPRMLVEFVDGSKTMVEMVALANATGLIPDIPGMHGPSAPLDSLHKVFCPTRGGRPAVAQGRRRLHGRAGRRARRVRRRRDAPSAAARTDERPATRRGPVLHVLPSLSPDEPGSAAVRPPPPCSTDRATCARCRCRSPKSARVAKRDLAPGETLDADRRILLSRLRVVARRCAWRSNALPLGLAQGANVTRHDRARANT